MHPCFCCVNVCGVFLQDKSKSNRSMNMKFEHFVVHENNSTQYWSVLIKVKVTVSLQRFFIHRNTNCQVL